VPYIVYDGHLMSSEDLGNYHFGYIGAAYGLPISMLHMGAGVYQLKNVFSDHSVLGNWQWGFDEPQDWYYIEEGYNAYWRDR
jgi:hypothetical protein